MILPSSNPFLQPEMVNQHSKQANKHSIHSSLLFSSFHSSFQTNKQNKTINQSSESTQSNESIASVKEPIAVISHSLRLILSLHSPQAQYTYHRSVARPPRTSPRESAGTPQKPDQFPQAQKPRSKTRCDLQGPAAPSTTTLKIARQTHMDRLANATARCKHRITDENVHVRNILRKLAVVKLERNIRSFLRELPW